MQGPSSGGAEINTNGEHINYQEIKSLKDGFAKYEELGLINAKLAWQIVELLGMRGYWNTHKISARLAITQPNIFLQNLKNRFQYPIIENFFQARGELERFSKHHFRTDPENSWYKIAGRLRNAFPQWSKRDDENTKMFQKLNPGFMDAKEGECLQMIEPSEFVAKITDPTIMAAMYIREFYRNPSAKQNRRGWDILVSDAGVWYRRAILDAGFTDEKIPFFVLDSNLYLAHEKVASGSSEIAEVISVHPVVARRFPPRGVSRGFSDYDVLPVIDGETAINSFIVIQNPDDPPA